MGTTAEPSKDAAKRHLLDVLTRQTDSITEFSRIEFNLDYVDRLSETFIDSAVKLVDTGHPDEREAAADYLRLWISDDKGVPAAHNSSDDFNESLGTNFNAASYILDEVNRRTSNERLMIISPDGDLIRAREMSYLGDKLILENQASLRPDLLDASKYEIDRYYHPMMVASVVADPKKAEDRFVAEAPGFITWAAAQEDMIPLLSLALKLNSIDPETLEAIKGMRSVTAVPLYDGLL